LSAFIPLLISVILFVLIFFTFSTNKIEQSGEYRSSAGLLRRVVFWLYANVSEGRTASIIRAEGRYCSFTNFFLLSPILKLVLQCNVVIKLRLPGSNYGGEADGYYGHSGTDFANPPYNITAVTHSVTGEAIASLLPSAIPDEEEILLLRADSTVTCAVQADKAPCDPAATANPCLFDLAVDPCETNNLAYRHPEVLQEMLDLVSKYEATLVPQLNKPVDVKGSDPRKFNNTWSPWVDT
jgi:hypothetical protein